MSLFNRRCPPTSFSNAQPAPLLQSFKLRSETCRQHSQQGTSTSGREAPIVCTAWLSPQEFNTSKLTVTFLPCASEEGPQLPSPRKYTLTHSDITGQLRLSVGQQYNQAQLSGWYLQLFRDEVLAEWLLDGDGKPQLHLFCHISSDRRWSGPIPPALRSRVFQREIPLVLKSLLHGDRAYLRNDPQLLSAAVFLHLSSHVQALNMLMDWGVFGDEKSWRRPPKRRLLEPWWKSKIEPCAPTSVEAPPSQMLLESAAAAEPVEPAKFSNGAAIKEAANSNGATIHETVKSSNGTTPWKGDCSNRLEGAVPSGTTTKDSASGSVAEQGALSRARKECLSCLTTLRAEPVHQYMRRSRPQSAAGVEDRDDEGGPDAKAVAKPGTERDAGEEDRELELSCGPSKSSRTASSYGRPDSW